VAKGLKYSKEEVAAEEAQIVESSKKVPCPHCSKDTTVTFKDLQIGRGRALLTRKTCWNCKRHISYFRKREMDGDVDQVVIEAQLGF
jgi:hypothetical protein